MYSKTRILGHPIHPILVSFPIGFYAGTLVAFIVYGAHGNLFFFQAGVALSLCGIVMAAVAALPGFIDWAWGIPSTDPAKSTGFIHLLLNVSALAAFVITFIVGVSSWDRPANTAWCIVFAAIGMGLTGIAGWFGAELVQRHHVGIEPVSTEGEARARMVPTPRSRSVPSH